MSTPAGWYDDGSGRQRWWDGQQWTEHYAPSAVVGPTPVAPTGAVPQTSSPAAGVPKSPATLGFIGLALAVLGTILACIPTAVTFGIAVFVLFAAFVLSVIAVFIRNTTKWPSIVGALLAVAGGVVGAIVLVVGLVTGLPDEAPSAAGTGTDASTDAPEAPATSEEPSEEPSESAEGWSPNEDEAAQQICESTGVCWDREGPTPDYTPEYCAHLRYFYGEDPSGETQQQKAAALGATTDSFAPFWALAGKVLSGETTISAKTQKSLDVVLTSMYFGGYVECDFSD